MVGLARAAATAGARLYENTRARAISSDGGKVTVKTDAGDIVAGLFRFTRQLGNADRQPTL